MYKVNRLKIEPIAFFRMSSLTTKAKGAGGQTENNEIIAYIQNVRLDVHTYIEHQRFSVQEKQLHRCVLFEVCDLLDVKPVQSFGARSVT